jgi:DNA-binding CsgD family transcriptional regulator/tetratricopeptide (TPR) repeat protein
VTISLSPNSPALLVGRERELGVLRAHLDAALAGHGGLVLISGEAGIGKTALVETLCAEAAGQGAMVLVGRCFDRAETPAYGPWIELFGQYHPNDGLPALPAVFADRGTVGEAPSQAALFRQALDFFAACQRPLLVALEDLHWSDLASLDLLRFVVRSLATFPLLFLVTYRADELPRDHPLTQLLPVIIRESAAARLGLRPLRSADLLTLIAGRYHLSESDTSRLIAYLDGRAEGNPLFLGELLRTLEEEGLLRTEAHRWLLGDLTRVQVPALLRTVIEGRIGRLGEAARGLLAIAAVIGQEIPADLWMRVAEVGEAAILDLVERAGEARIVEETPSGDGVRFHHALIREAIYEGIPALRRRKMHRQVGEALAALPQADPDAVAYHFRQAADARAAEWLVKAGERAQRALAWLTAAERFDAAAALMEAAGRGAGERGWLLLRLALMRRFGDTAQAITHLNAAGQLATQADDRLLSAQVIFYRGNLHCLAGRLGEGVAEMADGIAALEALPPIDVTARPEIDLRDVTGARVTHYTWLGNVGRFAEARAFGERLGAEIAASTPDGMASSRYAEVVGGLQQVYAYQGDLETAYRTFIAVYDVRRAGSGHLWLGVILMYELLWETLPYRADDVAERRRLAAEAEGAWARGSGARTDVPARFARSPVLFLEGQWDEARALALAGHTESGGYVLSKLFAFTTLGPLAQAQGDAKLAAWLVREWLPDGPATPPGNTFYAVTILQRMAAAMAIDANDLPAARAWLEAHDRWLAWSGAVLGQAERHIAWARYHRAADDPTAASAHATQALAHASTPRQPLALLAAHRLLGELDSASAQFENALHHLMEALTLADACQAPYERALVLLADAELRAATGKDAVALRLLDEVRAICTPLGAKPALAQIDALASRLPSTRPAPPAYPAGLSAREVEVLRLVAGGLSNRDIAEALFLSKRTVQVHVAHILAKTDSDNRAAAAAFALRHGLA